MQAEEGNGADRHGTGSLPAAPARELNTGDRQTAQGTKVTPAND